MPLKIIAQNFIMESTKLSDPHMSKTTGESIIIYIYIVVSPKRLQIDKGGTWVVGTATMGIDGRKRGLL